jgi:rubrerythrin
MTKWRCLICGYIHQGPRPPSHCPICGAPASMFEKLEDPRADGGPKA